MTACAASGYLSRIVCVTPQDCPGGIDGGYTCPTNKSTDSTAGLYKTCHAPVVDAGAVADAGTE
jgi:hypothetical protein